MWRPRVSARSYGVEVKVAEVLGLTEVQIAVLGENLPLGVIICEGEVAVAVSVVAAMGLRGRC